MSFYPHSAVPEQGGRANEIFNVITTKKKFHMTKVTKSVIILSLIKPLGLSAWTQIVGSKKGKTCFRLFETKTEIPKGRLVHLPGLFESLSSLRVHNWVEATSDEVVCRGDECDNQCEIPDDWKKTSVHVDVLDFLGIKRAGPLRDQKS